MPTRHRNSKSHKKSLRNRVQKGGAKLEKGSVKLTNIKNINDLDGATYTQDLMNIHSYKIRVFNTNMTFDYFKKEVDFEIEISNNKTTFIHDILNRYTFLKKDLDLININNNTITEFTLLWNFKDSKIKIDTPITISVPFYTSPVDIEIDSFTKCILFNSSNIYIFNLTFSAPSVDTIPAGSVILPEKIVEYYKSQAFGIKTAIGKAATTIGKVATTIKTAATDTSNYMKEKQPILTTAKKVMSADLTGACNRCTYTFSEEEQQQVLALLGGQYGTSFNANLSFDNGKLTLVTNDTPQE